MFHEQKKVQPANESPANENGDPPSDTKKTSSTYDLRRE